MKKLLILFLLASLGVNGQSITLEPTSSFSGTQLNIVNNLNQAGLVHSSTNAAGPSIGTVIKADGAYLQTFSNHPLKLAVNDNATENLQINTQGNVILPGGLQFFVNTIKQIKLTGLTDGYDPLFPTTTNDGLPFETRIAHGLNASKIISIKIIVVAATGFSVGEEYSYNPLYRVGLSYDNTDIHIWNYSSSTLIRTKPFKVLITYTL